MAKKKQKAEEYGTISNESRVDPEWIPRPHAGHFIVTFKMQSQMCGLWFLESQRA